MEKQHYGAIDGLRAIACIGIVMMHVRANSNYEIGGFIYNSVIPSFTNFVFLFMAVSAFGMCCGYYEKVKNNTISFRTFYGKRFKKILPFFGVLVLLDVVLSPSTDALYEAFANLTLLFGFLPDAGSISVIGVGWFLGLIFVFYICFPFFCVLIQTKRQAWLVFSLSLVYNFACSAYFHVGRTNILYCGCYFLTGGLIYLYREEIQKGSRPLVGGIAAVSVVLYYVIGGNTLACLLVFASWLSYAVICSGGAKQKRSLLHSKAAKFVSGISMEIYLSHMVIYRVAERLGMVTVASNGLVQYIVTVTIVLCGTVLLAVTLRKIIGLMETKICYKTTED